MMKGIFYIDNICDIYVSFDRYKCLDTINAIAQGRNTIINYVHN